MKLTVDAWMAEENTADDMADALDLIARQLREGCVAGDAEGRGWWTIEGLGEPRS